MNVHSHIQYKHQGNKVGRNTVTFQPIKPSSPIMIITEGAQPNNGIITHLRFLNINQSVKIIKMKTPIPKTMISLFMKLIISSAIIGMPPR